MDNVSNIVNDTINATINATKSHVALTFESGLSSIALFIMAIVPIYLGSMRSVNALKKSLDNENIDDLEILSKGDVAKFPLYASGTLLGIYIVFKVFAAKYINMLLSIYFFFLGTVTIFLLIRERINKIVPSCFPNTVLSLRLVESPDQEIPEYKECFDFKFERKDVVPLLLSLLVGVSYFMTQHWIPNNIIAMAIAVTAIEYLHLDKAINGCILLGGLFFYDIFWVFATDVMVTVAKSFDAPIKVVFPRNILTGGLFSTELSMLGLGDIVIPGIFLSLLLRFDRNLNRNGSCTYFWTAFFAYVVGILATFAAMYISEHAQPALLYLVPTCLGFPLSLALIRGDFPKLMEYKDIPEEIADKIKADREAKKAENSKKSL